MSGGSKCEKGEKDGATEGVVCIWRRGKRTRGSVVGGVVDSSEYGDATVIIILLVADCG